MSCYQGNEDLDYDGINANRDEEPDRAWCEECQGVRYMDGPSNTCGFCGSHAPRRGEKL